MRHNSLVRTGLLSNSTMPRAAAAKREYAARLFQMRWRGLKMRIYLKAKVDAGEIKPENERAYEMLLDFILRLKKSKLDERNDRVLLHRVRQKLAPLITGVKPPEDGTVPDHVLKEDKQMLALVRSASMAARTRPPMTTLYAVHLIQARRRSVLEQRAFAWLRRNVSQMQAVWRGKVERRRIASFLTAVKLLQAFLRFRWLLKGIRFKMDIWADKKDQKKKYETLASKTKLGEVNASESTRRSSEATRCPQRATAAGVRAAASTADVAANDVDSPVGPPGMQRGKSGRRVRKTSKAAPQKTSDIVGSGIAFSAFEL